MVVFKDHQFLVFQLDDGSVVKYDFSTKTPIGKKGFRVKNLKGQLQNITIDDICDCCKDPQYGKFLRFVMNQGGVRGNVISNIGTVLERVPMFAQHEQYFAAGIDNISSYISYKINDVPRGLLSFYRRKGLRLTNEVISNYKMYPDAYTLMFNMEFQSLTDSDFSILLSHSITTYDRDLGVHKKYPYFGYLIDRYGYQAKALLNYIDTLKTFEAMERIDSMLTEINDYARMMSEISRKFDRYPKHFLTTHRIAIRNYERLKAKFDEEAFAKRINKGMENEIGEYVFIYPNCTQDIKDEAVQQNNCVSSYISRVINGECDIMFMRSKNNPDKSLVTLEVVDGQIVQAKQHFNYEVTISQKQAINKWNTWYSLKMKGESNNAKCA